MHDRGLVHDGVFYAAWLRNLSSVHALHARVSSILKGAAGAPYSLFQPDLLMLSG